MKIITNGVIDKNKIEKCLEIVPQGDLEGIQSIEIRNEIGPYGADDYGAYDDDGKGKIRLYFKSIMGSNNPIDNLAETLYHEIGHHVEIGEGRPYHDACHIRFSHLHFLIERSAEKYAKKMMHTRESG